MRNKRPARAALLAVLLLAALAAGLVAVCFTSHTRLENVGYYDNDEFVDALRLCLLTRYWQARCEWDGACAPSVLLLDDTNSCSYALLSAGEELSTILQEEADGDSESLGTRGGLKVYTEQAADAIDEFNSTFRTITDDFTINWGNLYCTVVNNETGAVYAPRLDLSGLLDGASLNGAWNYIQITQYDKAGALARQETFRADDGLYDMENDVRLSAQSSDTKGWLHNWFGSKIFDSYDYRPPHDVTVIFAIPRVLAAGDMVSFYAQRAQSISLYIAYDSFYNIAFLCACGLALLFGFRNGAGLGRGYLARLPVEAGLLMLLCAGILVRDPLYTLCWNTANGALAQTFADRLSLDPPAGDAVAYAATWAAAWVALAGGFASVLSLRQAVSVYGLRGTFTQRCLCWHGACWCGRLLRRLWRAVCARCGHAWRAWTRIDLREPVDRTLVRLLAVNFFVLAFICCFWFAGIFGVLIYSVLLFLFLRGRVRAEQRHYETLLTAARRMAAGDLTTPVTGDLGLFNPLRGELDKVRAGFETAVEEEVRSRNMKTELITNVSHDLKTPLTAIITYIDLLKDETLAPEVRAQYTDTLDKKSQRLKRLIEDLFEISKAASGNAVMHYAEVDLPSLLRQVACELADTMEQSGVDFRWQMPEHRVPLVLDGQKTCRIFENLIVNITKYALPGTRAYITLTETEDGAAVECKNVSAAELDFDTKAITDRFVRGDRARSTEGSGLGLAIVKSFAELQGGAFEVITDGDLFKAVVRFVRGNAPEAQPREELP